jgi:hypothetical protein
VITYAFIRFFSMHAARPTHIRLYRLLGQVSYAHLETLAPQYDSILQHPALPSFRIPAGNLNLFTQVPGQSFDWLRPVLSSTWQFMVKRLKSAAKTGRKHSGCLLSSVLSLSMGSAVYQREVGANLVVLITALLHRWKLMHLSP